MRKKPARSKEILTSLMLCVTVFLFGMLLTSELSAQNRFTNFTPPRFVETVPSRNGTNFEVMMRLAEVVEKRKSANSEYKNGLIGWIDAIKRQNPDALLLTSLIKQRSRLTNMTYKYLGHHSARGTLDEIRITISNEISSAESRERAEREARDRAERDAQKKIESDRYDEIEECIGWLKEADEKNDYQLMIQLTSRIITLGHDSDIMFIVRGEAKANMKDWRGAELDFTRAINMGTDKPEVFIYRGLVRIPLNKKDEACLDFSKGGELGMPEAFELIQKNCQ